VKSSVVDFGLARVSISSKRLSSYILFKLDTLKIQKEAFFYKKFQT